MKQISSEKRPIKIWTDYIEEGALKQAKHLANLPFTYKHVALMPDVHQGYGMPIGGVLATKGVIIPNAVGSDIGCGMCAIKTSLTEIDKKILEKVIKEVKQVIPVGKKSHKEKQDKNLMPKLDPYYFYCDFDNIVANEFENALYQLGTLGGGNHFCEFQKGSDNHIWIMIHSGSRNLGNKVARYYNDLAVKFNERWFSQVPKEWELAFLPSGTKEAQIYFDEMSYCIQYAFQNRKLMMNRVCEILEKYTKCSFEPMINIAHNYVALENHFGKNVWVHRKGATQAKKGQIGIIPGSQGTNSYIVEGLGNPESFLSCSHGAGRILGRKQAKKELDLKKEINNLNKKGIIHFIKTKEDLDEAPSAYKNIDKVMENQKDLVKPVVKLQPLAVIKG